ncbi:MAG TPA: tRNA (guanosine(46)-N7)-methyltransferase TrmB, partial [Gammaproteobacteria bacterium]
MSDLIKNPRTIRSFVLRTGRITAAQKQALNTLWPRYGFDPGDSVLDFSALFNRIAPVIVEIGFGNGAALAAMAAQHHDYNFIGIEVHKPGIGHAL